MKRLIQFIIALVFMAMNGWAQNDSTCNAEFTVVPDVNTVNTFHFIPTYPAFFYTYSWNFGDGGTAVTPDPHHTYTQSGVYMACLTITGPNGCQDTWCDSVWVGITPPCNAFFSFTVNPATYLVEFTDLSSGNPTTWMWSFGDGTGSSLQNPTHIFPGPGTYPVTLTISCSGCTSTYNMTITIGGSTGCDASWLGIQDSVATNSYHFFSTSTGIIYHYLWNFGDGTTDSTMNPYHTFAQQGVYLVCLTIYGPNCQDISCDSVYVGTNPNPCMNYISFSVQGNIVHFIGLATGGNGPYTYLWSFGDGTTGTTHDPSHTYSQPGTYTITLTTTDATGCVFTSTVIVTIVNQTTVSIYGTVFADNTPLDLGWAFLYYGGNGTLLTVIDSAYIDSTGMYYFHNVPAIPGHYFVKAAPSGNSSFFSTHLPTYYGHTLFWANATPIIVAQLNNPYNIELIHVISPSQGNGNITGQVTEGGKNLLTDGVPAPDVAILLLNTANQPLSIDYSDVDGYFSFSNLGMGTYKLYAEVTGLTTDPAIVTLSLNNPVVNNASIIITPSGVITGIDEPGEPVSVQNLYPNPASNITYLEISLARATTLDLFLINLLGEKVNSSSLALSAGFHRIPVSTEDIRSGVYLLQINTAEGHKHLNKLTVIK